MDVTTLAEAAGKYGVIGLLAIFMAYIIWQLVTVHLKDMNESLKANTVVLSNLCVVIERLKTYLEENEKKN